MIHLIFRWSVCLIGPFVSLLELSVDVIFAIIQSQTQSVGTGCICERFLSSTATCPTCHDFFPVISQGIYHSALSSPVLALLNDLVWILTNYLRVMYFTWPWSICCLICIDSFFLRLLFSHYVRLTMLSLYRHTFSVLVMESSECLLGCLMALNGIPFGFYLY